MYIAAQRRRKDRRGTERRKIQENQRHSDDVGGQVGSNRRGRILWTLEGQRGRPSPRWICRGEFWEDIQYVRDLRQVKQRVREPKSEERDWVEGYGTRI